MREKVKATAGRYRLLDSESHGLQEPVQLPIMRTERVHVTDRAHRHFDEPCRISEWLGRGGRLHDVRVHGIRRLLLRRAAGMRGIERTHPVEALFQKKPLKVFA